HWRSSGVGPQLLFVRRGSATADQHFQCADLHISDGIDERLDPLDRLEPSQESDLQGQAAVPPARLCMHRLLEVGAVDYAGVADTGEDAEADDPAPQT